MTLFSIGAVWLILLIISCFYNIKYTAMLLLISYVLQASSFMELPFALIKNSEISCIIFLIRYAFVVFNGRTIKLNKSGKLLLQFLCVLIFITLFSGIVFKGTEFPLYHVTTTGVLMTIRTTQISLGSKMIGPLLRITLAVLVFISMINLKKCSSISEKDIITTLKISIWIVTIVGIIQYLNTFNVIDLKDIVQVFHYERSTDEKMTDSFYRGTGQLYSTFMEPSYLAQWLVSMLAYISFSKEWKRKNLYITILIIELVLSFSATGVVGMLLFLIYSAMKSAEKGSVSAKWIVRCFGIVIGLLIFVLFVPYGQKIIEMVSAKLDSQSGIERIAYIKLSFNAFLKSYGLGMGYNQVQGMTLFIGLLGQVGIIGTIVFLKFILFLYKEKNITNQYKAMLLSSVVCNCISCPGLLPHIPLWSVLYYVAIAVGESKNKKKETMEKICLINNNS